MIGDQYPDDCVTEAVPDGAPPFSFDDEESDENESADTSIGYGSLLNLGASIRKKRPLIVVDPVEAENEARRVQFIAAQQLVDADESEGIDFLKGLASLVGPEVPDPDVVGCETGRADGDAAPGEPMATPAEDHAPSVDLAGEPAACECSIGADEGGAIQGPQADEAAADSGGPSDVPEEPAETRDCEMPMAIAEAAGSEDAGIGPIATVIQLEPARCEAPDLQPASGPRGHRLRARVPGRQSRVTLADRMAAFLAGLHDWLRRGRP